MSDSIDIPIIAPFNPVFANPGDAGADLVAAEEVYIGPGERAIVSTALRLALPIGFVAFVVPRSGLAAKHGITVLNSPGVIDAGYRGEVKVILLNTDREQGYQIESGDRVAQLIVMKLPPVSFVSVEELDQTVRGSGGFGSSGYQQEEGSK